MSSATTVKQARLEFYADLKRLCPKRDELVQAMAESVQDMAQRLEKRQRNSSEAVASFIAANKAAFEAHLAAEEAAE